MQIEIDIARGADAHDVGVQRLGAPSPFACPECHGVLRQIAEGGRRRFRCHSGHAYSTESLVASLSESAEEALWNAIRALDECGRLLSYFGESYADEAAKDAALTTSAAQAFEDAETLRAIVFRRRRSREREEM